MTKVGDKKTDLEVQVISKHGDWSEFPTIRGKNSQWISPYSSSGYIGEGEFVMKRCFCLKEGFQNVKVETMQMADDEVRLKFNGKEIPQKGTLSFKHNFTKIVDNDNFYKVEAGVIEDQSLFKTGVNCLEYHVKDTGSIAMGLHHL